MTHAVRVNDPARDLVQTQEIKRAPLAIGAVSAAGVFEGYASVFGVLDLGRDVVARGAFAASLVRRGPDKVKLLWQHDSGQPIGTWLSIEEDARGLKVRGRLNLAVARAREVLSLIREGAVDGLSIGSAPARPRPTARRACGVCCRSNSWRFRSLPFRCCRRRASRR